MRILSHRGYWKTAAEKNSKIAFERSFSLGFGTETDIRDFDQELVVSHDMAGAANFRLSELLNLVGSAPITLALNIKSDGLAFELKRLLGKFSNQEFFVFDMSVPDMRHYLALGLPVFTRMSEFEKEPVFLKESTGVWLDGFETEWFDNSTIQKLCNMGKQVCVVSSELHRRNHASLWESLKPLQNEPGLMLCTDFPEEAREFFRN